MNRSATAPRSRSRRPAALTESHQTLSRACAAVEELETRRLFAIITVNTAIDEQIANGTTSLREAIAQASGTSGGDTINLAASAFPNGTLTNIQLATRLSITDATGVITINGRGDAVSGIDGNDATRLFEIGSTARVVIQKLALTGGRDAAGGGGGAIDNGGDLTLRSVLVADNRAQSANGIPGVGANPGGIAEPVYGGAVYNSGTLLVEDSEFNDNEAVAGSGGSAAQAGAGAGAGGYANGGAIFSNGDLTVRDTLFLNNSAHGGAAGAIIGANATSSQPGSALGGAVALEPGAATLLERVTFENNHAFGGAGGGTTAGFTGGGGASAFGGAVYGNSADLAVVDSTFNFNTAEAGAGGGGTGVTPGEGGTARGGALYNGNVTEISGTDFEQNAAIGATGGSAGFGIGGAIYSDEDLLVTDSNFTGNQAYGGNGATNGGDGVGGAISNASGDLQIDSVTFVDNVASGGGSSGAGVAGQGRGGAISNTGDVDLAYSTLSLNLAIGGVGSTPTGSGAGRGGAIYHNGGNLTVRHSTLDHNTARGANGGAAVNGNNGGVADGGALHAGATALVYNSTLAFNSVVGGKGGNAQPGGNGGNGGDALGGAIRQDNAVALNLLNVTIADNDATGGLAGTGGFSSTGGAASGGGVSVNGNGVTATNSILYGNTAGLAVSDIAGGPAVDVGVYFSIVGGGTYTAALNSTNVSAADPMLGALQDNGGLTDTMRPDENGPAVDAGDNARALAVVTSDSFDQRGTPFARFVNTTIDLGAVEVQDDPPVIVVRGNGNVIADGDTTPSNTDNTNFGSVSQGASGPTRTFVVKNEGGSTLTLLAPGLPGGYTIVEPLDTSIAAGLSDSFTVRLSTANAGTFGGEIVITSNDTATLLYNFAVTGTVNPVGSAPPVKINFQPAGRPTPGGYLADVGQVFGSRGNGFSYGWNQDISVATRDRNLNADQKIDTLVHTQLYGSRTWEIAVPNGTYNIKLVAGDPQYFDSVYKINVEGVLTVNGTPTSGNRFITGTSTVTVSDGKLTVTNAAGAVNNKFDYIEISPAPVQPATTKINFQPGGSSIPAGYLVDSGQVFGSRGNGLSYGWNQTAASFTRDRNAGLSPDQRYDTIIHTQLYGTRVWEMAVPNGSYQVRVVAGDPGFIDSVYRFNVEGQLMVNGTPTSGNRWVEGTKTVTVSDGRLTISNASGSVNNKLAFVEIEAL